MDTITDKAVVFIDGGFFDVILHEFDNPRINYQTFSDGLCGSNERFRTYYYHCLPWQSSSPTEEERNNFSNRQKFYYRLQNLHRFTVRKGRLQNIGGTFKQKGVDVQIACDVIKLCQTSRIQTAIFIICDSDFVPMIQAIEDPSITTILFHSLRNKAHYTLSQLFDETNLITRDLLERHLR